jgi:hypothetical protein
LIPAALLPVLAGIVLMLGKIRSDDIVSLPDLPVEKSATLNGIQFSQKIWVHRVNTVDRANILLPKFAGIEIDVVYDSALDVFDVRHRDIESVGLSLEHYFELLDEKYRPYYWIDIKNLTTDNELRQYDRLHKLAKKYDLLDRLVVESTNTAALTRFTDAGFRTSYYLPHVEIESLSEADIEDWVMSVRRGLNSGRVRAISADYSMYPLIEKYFGDADTLLWAGFRYDKASQRDQIDKITAIERVKVLLVRQPSEHYR